MGTKHLTEADRLRARTLFFDAGLPKARICQITGFSLNQVKLAIREKTPKTRSGRPPRRRPGASAAAGSSVAGATGDDPLDIAQGVHGSEAVGEHSEHGEQGEGGSLISSAVDEAAAAAVNPAHLQGDRTPTVHHYGQQHQQQHTHQQQHQQAHQQHQQYQHQQHLQHHGHHHPAKWEPEYHHQGGPSYASWTQLAPNSPNSVVGGGPRGSATPASPPLPPPTASSVCMLPTVAPLGIPQAYVSEKGRGDAGFGVGVGSVGSVSSRDGGRSSDGHDFSSSTSSSSLASSAASYSSMSSSASGGGFSLPSILSSATGP